MFKPHATARAKENLSVMQRPQFYTDVTRPQPILDIQRKYDVEREARHLATTIYSYNDVQRLLTLPCCRFYEYDNDVSRHILEEPSINRISETAEIEKLMLMDKGEDLITKDAWLPQRNRRTIEAYKAETARAAFQFSLWDCSCGGREANVSFIQVVSISVYTPYESN